MVRAKPSSACGCGSIYLVEHAPGTLVEDQPLLSPIVRTQAFDESGELIGLVLLYQRRGLLYEMETFAYTETQLPIPNPRSARMLPPEPVAPHRDATVIPVSASVGPATMVTRRTRRGSGTSPPDRTEARGIRQDHRR